jgi:hypothetical protein
MAFKKAKCEQAFAKFGILGFTGTGKTFLAKGVAIGLHKLCVAKGSMKQDTPVFFLDTETGSDWVREYFEKENIDLMVDKTRAFTRLVPAILEVEKQKGILIIDSVTHFWRELTESYAKQKNRSSLRFEDWAWLKSQWGRFTDALVNSSCHILMCGRAGFEYDYYQDESGKRELAKTGIKMKAEGETGYEPSMLILMERETEMEGSSIKNIYRTGHVLKDRSNTIDGKVFRNPSFEDFLPHLNGLNVGGEHVGVDLSQSSAGIVPPDIRKWEKDKIELGAVLDEIQCELTRRFPSTSNADKAGKMDFLEKHSATRSWKRLETMQLPDLRSILDSMLNGTNSPVEVKPPSTHAQAEELF